ncbi:MAG: hypothetical protein ACI8TP_001053 [Acidimicrobiales bacterium]|jgi:hypothetical protein
MTSDDDLRPKGKMASNHGIEQRLESLGSERGPDVDGAFANRLEADLRLAMADRTGSTRRPLWQPVLAGAAALLAIVVGVAVLANSGSNGVDIEPATSVLNTDVATTAGSAVDPTAVDSDSDDDGSPTTSGSGPTATAERGSDSGDGRSDGSTTSPETTRPTGGAGNTTVPVGPTTSLDPTSVPERTTTTSATRSTDGPATTTPMSIGLTLSSAGDTTLRLDWELVGDVAHAGWRVEAIAGDRTTTILVLRDAGARTATIERIAGRVGYRVSAVDIDGNKLGSSETVTAAES